MQLKDIRKITHEHKIELFLLLFAGLFDISFGIEKILIWKNVVVHPLVWAIIYLTFGVISTAVAIWDVKYDIHKDCNKEP